MTPELEDMVRRHVIGLLSTPWFVEMKPKGIVVEYDGAFPEYDNAFHSGTSGRAVLRWSWHQASLPTSVTPGEPIHMPDLELLIRAVLEI